MLSGPNGTHAAAGADGRAGTDGAALTAALPGLVTGELDPQVIFATESLAQALRQLEIYGRDGLPVLSDDAQRITGWVTSTAVISAVAGEIRTARSATSPGHRDTCRF